MKLEQRYIVLKVKDIGLLDTRQQEEFNHMLGYLEQRRKRSGKRPLEAVVIEQGWPEYEPTVALLAARVGGTPVSAKKVGQLTLEVGMRTAPPQDERELPPPYGWVAVGEFFTDRAKAIEAAEKTPCIEVYSRPQMLTRPAQTEQHERGEFAEALRLLELSHTVQGVDTKTVHAFLDRHKAALSRQAEPDHVEDMRAMVEPAPAQDDREMGELRIRLENGRRQFEFEEYDAAYSLPAGTHYLYTRPAQTEQQPVAEAPAGKKVGELMVEVGFSGNKVSELVQFILDAVAEGGMTAECAEELGRHLQALAVTEVSPDANVELNRKMLLDRSVVGLKKYGVTTEREDLTPAQWAQHAIEEALDFANYLQALKKKLEDLDNG